MDIFVLGGSGFIGSAVVRELLAHGHAVTALARSESSAGALAKAGCNVLHGDIRTPRDWLDKLGAPEAIVHMADTFDDDMAAVDRHLMDSLLDHLNGQVARSRFLYTGGCWLYGENDVITEESAFDPLSDFAWMTQRDRLLASASVEAIVVHPAMVYDLGSGGDFGVLSMFVRDARAGGPVQVVGGESVRWPLVHRDDLAVLYRLALERGRAGADYHGVGEAGVPVGAIARAIAARFGAPPTLEVKSVEAITAELGSWARGYALDQCMVGVRTREELGWLPKHTDILRALNEPLSSAAGA